MKHLEIEKFAVGDRFQDDLEPEDIWVITNIEVEFVSNENNMTVTYDMRRTRDGETRLVEAKSWLNYATGGRMIRI